MTEAPGEAVQTARAGSPERPLRVAVVGSGPSGFYAVQHLYRLNDMAVRVDLFDRLPTPYGLVRGGVAPDHQNIKAVARAYERLATSSEGFRFFGNTTIGRDLTVEELEDHYDAILWAVGNEGERGLGVPGEDLQGVHSATRFVFWYNGHPDYCGLAFDLARARRVMVIGNGNVAIDVARVLAHDPAALASTDIADHALEALRQSNVEEIVLLGRRGPAQAAFTPTEIRELAHLESADLVVPPEELVLDPATETALTEGSSPADENVRKNLEVLREQARLGPGTKLRKVVTRFLVSAQAFLGDEQGHLRGVRLVRNRLEPRGSDLAAVATDETWEEDVDLVLMAIGYRGIPVEGLPFDEKHGIIPNESGRVIDPSTGKRLSGHYVAGWAKRGPTGLIGTNKSCAKDTVALLWEDYQDRQLPPPPVGDVADLLASRGVRSVSFEEWLRIDKAEQEAGKAEGRIRRKFTQVDQMLALLEG